MSAPRIARHRTAIHRHRVSRPVRLALDDQVIAEERSVFDFGCGHGDDLRFLKKIGVSCSGWDPVHRPNVERTPADVVNIGYVLNVIENVAERARTLQDAWNLAQCVLVVAARLELEGPGGHDKTFADGYVTRLGTFQKYYQQHELRQFIAECLDHSPVAAGPGVFYVFRDPDQREAFLSTRQRRRSAAPQVRKSDALYEEHKLLLQGLIDFVGARGRLPEAGEVSQSAELQSVFGSIRRAFAVVRRATGVKGWTALRATRSQDLLVYFALSAFEGRPPFGKLPRSIQLDVREFFSTYKAACAHADELLYSAGNQELLDRATRGAGVGKQTPSALYVHTSLLEDLPPLLRVYEGCARVYIGAVDGADIIKLHRDRAAVSYLSYPAFETSPHPSLFGSFIVKLDGPVARYRDYSKSDNPPILHRKEQFVGDGHPLKEKFRRLTKQEENCGLFANPSEIGTKSGWETALKRYGVELRGHRLVHTRK